MNSNRFFSPRHVGLALLAISCSMCPLRAQTFLGAPSISAEPPRVEVAVYPVITRPSTLVVAFTNPTGKPVRIAIRNRQGEELYSEVKSIPFYRRRLNLMLLPTGQYTISVFRKEGQYTRNFRIEATEPSTHIAMESSPVQPDTAQYANPGLITIRKN